MKTEDLKKLGLTEEQQAEIFRLNGLAVDKIKEENATLQNTIQTLEKEKETISGQLETANNKIEEFSNMDIDSIKAESADYKLKYEESEKQRAIDLKDMNLNHTLETAFLKAGAKNTKAVKALLDIDGLKESQNLNEDIEKAILGLRESDSYLFDEVIDKKTIAGGGALPSGKEPSEMTYKEFEIAFEKGLIK